jgi:hypothetical protein
MVSCMTTASQRPALNAGLSLGTKATLGVIAGSLAQEETVRAIGLGHLNETAGYVVLTTRRLLIIEVSGPESRTLLDARHGSIEALSPGKRNTGETLRAVLPWGETTIARLGHGEGYGTIKTYREEQRERARALPSSARRSLAPVPPELLAS